MTPRYEPLGKWKHKFNYQSNQEDPPSQEPSRDPFDPNYYDIVVDKDEEAVVYQRTARLYAQPPTKWQTEQKRYPRATDFSFMDEVVDIIRARVGIKPGEGVGNKVGGGILVCQT